MKNLEQVDTESDEYKKATDVNRMPPSNQLEDIKKIYTKLLEVKAAIKNAQYSMWTWNGVLNEIYDSNKKNIADFEAIWGRLFLADAKLAVIEREGNVV